jgi:hypothetical protein
MRQLFVYNVPGKIGGASTKVRDLLRLVRNDFDITVVLGHVGFLKEREVVVFLNNLGIRYCLRQDLPDKVDAVALGVCELDFFTSGTAASVKKKGMKLVWSNEMMWEFKGEAEAVRDGLIDRVLFLSEIQRDAFAELYARVPQLLIRNYVTPEDFPYVERANPVFAIGRLSRPDPVKFPADFPVFCTVFVSNPSNLIGALSRSPVHVPIEVRLSKVDPTRRIYGMDANCYGSVLARCGVLNPAYLSGIGFWIVAHDAIEAFCDLATKGWHKAREIGHLLDESFALSYAMQMLCGDPAKHTVAARPDLWAADYYGWFSERLPGGGPWEFQDAAGADRFVVTPSIVHLAQSRAASAPWSSDTAGDFCG